MSHQIDLPMYPEPFDLLADAQDRVRALASHGGRYEIQWQPAFPVPTPPGRVQAFMPERFLVVKRA